MCSDTEHIHPLTTIRHDRHVLPRVKAYSFFTYLYGAQLHDETMIHPFKQTIAAADLPKRFTYPFHYTPHPLVIEASLCVKKHLEQQDYNQEVLEKGKMFGVLIVRDQAGQIGFLAAFSGLLAGSYHHPFFVGPIYDLQQKDGFFKKEEAEISQLNVRIKTLEQEQTYANLKQALVTLKKEANEALTELKAQQKANKSARQVLRQSDSLSSEQLSQLILASQHEKAHYKRCEKKYKAQIDDLSAQLATYQNKIADLKTERKNRSAQLQDQLFEAFVVTDSQGNDRTIKAIFQDTPQKTPPAGSGECAGPKLLAYAYAHKLHPICMGEFWWGKSPRNEIRQHGEFYPACMGKCFPILTYMMQGLEVDPNPIHLRTKKLTDLKICFEDEYLLVVNKPAGVLSTPGKGDTNSVYDWIQQKFPNANGPLLVHRLDMDTSGVLLIAKDAATHKLLQKQFANRSIKKRYVALLGAPITTIEGTINLPLAANYNDRPRQQVDYQKGKEAITHFEVISHEGNLTRIALFPLTGRTHQLRMHMAHKEGLNVAIMGDTLYGTEADRLYLHAQSITFTHPYRQQQITITTNVPF